jgi:hypothetical protein
MSSSDPRSQTVTPRLQPPMDSATAKTTTAAPQTKASPLHSLPKMTLPSFQELPLSNPTPRSQADRQRRQTRAWSYLRHYQTTPQQRDLRSHERPTHDPSPNTPPPRLDSSQPLLTAPLNRAFYNASNVPIQYGTPITTATLPSSLSLDPQVMQQDYTPPYHQRSMTASSETLPFCHDWTRSGITIDDSDFSTDFRRLSQLDVSMGGGEGASLVAGIM